MKTLKDTISGMLSSDSKQRLVSEIEQVDIRLYNLEKHMDKIGEDSPEYSLLEAQRKAMTEYLKTLTTRATTFQIKYNLPSIEERMKDFPDECKLNYGMCKLDPMFWLLVMFMLSERRGW